MIDVLVLGGGPSGAAAAIGAARSGMSAAILERSSFPRFRPGETLHPGIEPLLRQLGATSALDTAATVRHRGTWVAWGGPPRFDPFGADARGPWLGFQAPRAEFDAQLLRTAAAAGVEIHLGVKSWRTMVESGRVTGVRTNAREWRARRVVDAAGDRHQLARQLGIRVTRHSHRLIARYGYVTGACPELDQAPRIRADDTGWTWTARIGADRYQWTRVNCRDSSTERVPPAEFSAMQPSGPVRGADVTWRIAESTSGPGYFMVGDAAAVLDPSSSHGILRAVMTGIMAAHLVKANLDGSLSDRAAAARYHDWLGSWFKQDCARLRDLWLWPAKAVLTT